MDFLSRLAALKAERPEYAIFRRWQALRALRLDELSAEIAHLRQALYVATEPSSDTTDLEKGYSSPIEQFSHSLFSARSSHEQEIRDLLDQKLNQQGALPAEIAESLTDICTGKGLLLYRQLHCLPSANREHFNCLQEYLLDPAGGRSFLQNGGPEALIYDERELKDMTSLCLPNEREDVFTHFINTTVMRCYHNLLGYKSRRKVQVTDTLSGEEQEMPVVYYSERTILSVVNVVSTMLASLVPALTSLALFFMDSQLSRIGAIIGFSVLFSAVLMLVTNVTRAQCFAINSAFTAVLMVFVGNNGGGGCNC